MAEDETAVEQALELEHAIGYSAIENGLHYHPNGREFVYPAGASLVISEFEDAHNQSFLRGHDGPITAVSLSAKGRYVASGQRGENADALVWDFESRRLMYRLSEHDHEVSCLDFSHDERLLCTCGGVDDGKLIVWDMDTGYIVSTVALSPCPTRCVAFGGMVRDVKRRETDAYRLCCGGGTRLTLWALNPYTGEMTADTVDGRRELTRIQFSSDGETAYCATTSGDFTLVGVREKKMGPKPIFASRSGLYALVVRKNNKGILVGGGDGTVTAFGPDLIDTAQLVLPGSVTSLSPSPDESELLAGVSTGAIYRLRSDLSAALLVSENHAASVAAVSYAPETSDKFATASLDKTIRVWDANDYKAASTVTVRDAGNPTALVFTLDFIISGWTDGKIRAHDVEGDYPDEDDDDDNDQRPGDLVVGRQRSSSRKKKKNDDGGSLLWTIDNAHRDGVTALVIAPNLRFIVSGGGEGDVRVWEVSTRRLVSHLKEHRAVVTGLALYDDGLHALSCSRDRSFLCWDLRAEKRVTSHAQRMGGINAVALDKDQTNVFTVGQERRLTRWDLRDQNCLQQVDLEPPHVDDPTKTDEATCVAVSHSGRVVATGGTQKELKIWDATPQHCGRLIGTFPGHSGTITDLKFSPDDKQLVTVGLDGVCFVWNVFC